VNVVAAGLYTMLSHILFDVFFFFFFVVVVVVVVVVVADYQHMWGTPQDALSAISWDWFYALLSDGYSLQLVNFHEFPAASYLNIIDPHGINTLVPAGDWILTGSRPWTSPDPIVFNTTHALIVPAWDLNLTIATLQSDNLVRLLGQPVVYEGASQVTGTHRGVAVQGDAFTERQGFQQGRHLPM
jgi:predicted secreted hydrolase